MIRQRNRSDAAATAAMLCAGAMIAQQVGSKAARDAFFLSNFEVTALPLMVIAAALFSILVVFAASGTMARRGPARVMPLAFSGSAVALLLLWFLSALLPGVTAILLYLHVAALGSILISGFWSVVNEAFDPRTAKRQIGRIGAAAALGGLLGGVLAERVAASFQMTLILPALAILHFFCGLLIGRLKPPTTPLTAESVQSSEKTSDSLKRILREAPYIRQLAILVLVLTMAAALLDYVFKVQATEIFTDSAGLMRFFAIFYTTIGFLTFLVQLLAGRASMERPRGLATIVSTYPIAISVGSLAALLAPGLASATLARGAEALLRSSLFRSAYEALFTPVSPRDKRATKAIVDVGFERAGDVLGGAAVRLLLLFPVAFATPAMLATVILLAVLGFVLTQRLQDGYVKELEKRLLSGTFAFDPAAVENPMTRTMMMQTMATIALQRPELQRAILETTVILTKTASTATPARAPSEKSLPLDPAQVRQADLRSGDPFRVIKALESGAIGPELVSSVIPLLAWDTVYEVAVKELSKNTEDTIPKLVEALLDSDEEFAIRRRLPRVISSSANPQAVDGLLQGLFDRRFEVRFRCGRALARLVAREPPVRLDPDRVFTAVLQETHVDRRVWASQRLLDQLDEPDRPFVDEYLRDRSNRSLEHVFTMLSLVMETKPLQIAYKGLHTDDQMLQGTALEYLESTLRPDIRNALWPFLEVEPVKKEIQRGRDEILDSLMNSHHSIQLNLAKLRGTPPNQA